MTLDPHYLIWLMPAEGTLPHTQPSSAEDGFFMSRILIFANGELPDMEKARALLQPGDDILCADGGTRHALALGLNPSLVVGDLDSAAEEDLRDAERRGAQILRFPRDKDETDLELALQQALSRQPASILIVAALGRRLDQTLGNLSLLSHSRLAGLDIRFDDGVEQAFFCRTQAEVTGRPGDLLSLIPWGRAAVGVRTTGLRWPLSGETLYPERTRGISNELLGPAASISLSSGLLLVIHRRNDRA